MSPKKILIVDDDRNLTRVLSTRIKTLGVETCVAHDGMTAIKMIPTRNPDLLLLDVNMPTGSGLTVCAVLAQDQVLEPVPVIILTGRSDHETIARCEQLGAHYLKKSTDLWEHLRPLICELLNVQDTAPPSVEPQIQQKQESSETEERPASGTMPTVLVVDEDSDSSRVLKLKLAAHGVHVIRSFNGMQGYWSALKEKPQVIISDYIMPEGQGNYLLGRLKSHALTKNIPVMILTGSTVEGDKNYSLERELLGLGADCFLTKPLDFELLLKKLGKHITLKKHIPVDVTG